MAEIQPFRGYHYDVARAGKLSDVVAPPYDVIDAKMQDVLYDRNPHNVIRLILNKEERSDTEANNRYTRAARFLRDWTNDEILVQDRVPSLYVCHQEFKVEGRKFNRRGFFARVRLQKFGAGNIYPHEQTMPGPKADRLKLMHATAMNLSPIFGLYPDADGRIHEALDNVTKGQLPLEAADDLGVTSRLWTVADQNVVAQVAKWMLPHPIFIADGHHRYETALRYLEEKQNAGDVADDNAAPNFVMMMLVSMNDPGLAILPTHRLVSGIGNLNGGQLKGILNPHFEWEAEFRTSNDAWDLIEADGGQELLAFGLPAEGSWQVGRFRSTALMNQLAPDHSEQWRGLAVSVLHEAVLGKVLRDSRNADPQCRFVHLLSEVDEAMAGKTCDLTVLVPPATMTHVEEIAGQLEKMPPKSTYFYPKLLSGLVIHSLK